MQCSEHTKIDKQHHWYTDGAQWMRANPQRCSSFNTSVFWLMNDACAKLRLGRLPAVAGALVDAFKLTSAPESASVGTKDASPLAQRRAGRNKAGRPAPAGMGAGKGRPKKKSRRVGSNWAKLKTENGKRRARSKPT